MGTGGAGKVQFHPKLVYWNSVQNIKKMKDEKKKLGFFMGVAFW